MRHRSRLSGRCGHIGTVGHDINSRFSAGQPREPPHALAVLFVMKDIAMRRISNKNDWWDWGLILLIVAGGTLIVWAGVWVAHS